MNGSLRDAFYVSLGEFGVQEWSGNSHNPEVMKYFQECGFDTIKDDETAWCLKGDIEFLTDKGFVKLEDGTNNADFRVAQLNTSTHGVEFTSNFYWIIKKYKGEIYNINKRSINLSCDPNHEFYGKWSSSDIYQKRKINTITSYGVAIPQIHSLSPDYDISDRDLKLLAAFLSDGNRRFNRINFGVSKEHKIEILSELDPLIETDDTKTFGNRKRIRRYSFVCPEIFDKCLSDYKVMSWDFIVSLSERQCKLFIDTYSFFDGSRRTSDFSLFTSCDRLAECLIYIANMAGYKSTLSKIKQVGKNVKIEYLNTIYVSRNNRHKYIMRSHIEKEEFNGNLYCLQVPSGVFIIRDRNKNIIPIGNCSAAMCWSMMKADIPHTNSLLARSWLNWGKVLEVPHVPCVVVMEREGSSWMGHVGWWIKEQGSQVWVYGGNQHNTWCIDAYPKSNILGYRTWGE